jgi:hydrogenase large subunit
MAVHNVIIDPVTRIEGHLRIQAYARPDGRGGGTIQSPGLSSSTMVRGVERILQGRDPRDAWAFTQRICGVCTVVHGLTAVRAVENAVGIKVPKNADYIRNMMIGAQYVHDHVMHFYHLHSLDWVDVESALKANPAVTARLARHNNPSYKPNKGALPDAAYFQTVLNNLNNGLVNRGQLGLFSNAYWGHPAYKMNPEQNLLLLSHYLESLAWARDVVKLHAIFGGKDPHPNLVVGGMPCSVSTNTGAISLEQGGTSLNAQGFATVQTAVTRMQEFVNQVYLPDVLLLARVYKDWAKYGATVGNFMAFGDFPDPALVRNELVDQAMDYPAAYVMPQGVIWAGRPKTVVPFDPANVTENVAHAWYSGSRNGVHPSQGTTVLNYTGPRPDNPTAYMLDEDSQYSWIKSPRYQGQPMEVGPLAHILIMHGRNTLPTDKLVRSYVRSYWTQDLGLDFSQLNSTLGRIFCRMLETKIIADQIAGRPAGPEAHREGHEGRQDDREERIEAHEGRRGDRKERSEGRGGRRGDREDRGEGHEGRQDEREERTEAYAGWYALYYAGRSGKHFHPKAFEMVANARNKVGFGYTEAPRGALGHWIQIGADGMISNYQCVVASQWNAGPRDGNGTAGPYEFALKGHDLANLKKPLEVLRTIHSFDPCIGCAVHILDSDGEPLVEIEVKHLATV